MCIRDSVEFEERHKKGDILNLFFEEFVEEHLLQPTFVMDHPIEISPLTKKKPENPDYVERFEFFMNGWEMANAYSELNDPIDQRERFKAQEELLAQGDDEANTTDEDVYKRQGKGSCRGSKRELVDIRRGWRTKEMDLKGRDFLTLKDFTPEEIEYLVDLAADLKARKKAGIVERDMRGKNVALIFEKTSTRTRCAFEVAAHDLSLIHIYQVAKDLSRHC